jgi:phosphoglycolate phosphatase
MYRLLIFDLDGTLIDSVGDIADALNRVLGTSLEDRAVAQLVGSGVHELLRRAGVTQDLDAVAERYRAAYAEQPVHRTSLYLGVKETLVALERQGFELAIATNKPGALARQIVDRLGIDSLFTTVLGEDDVGARKPDPLLVDIVRGKSGTSRGQTLYVGDSLVDAETAEAARVDLCLVTYGYADPALIRARAARHKIDRFADLPGVLRSLPG